MRVWLSIATMALCAGCFYDSRWGDDKKVQQARAAQSRPALSSEPASAAHAAPVAASTNRESKRTLRVRALLARSFTVGVVDAPRHVRTVLDDASDVLESTLGARLELEGIRAWDLASDADLKAALAESKKADPGTDVDWVVGFVGALPRATQSFHDLGMGDVVGKHVVLRAPSTAEHHDALEASYGELSDDERRAIQKGAKRHRAAVVFLHEIGHTLGLVHERSARSIMFHQYGPRATSFSPESAAVMKVALDSRSPRTSREASDLYRELAATMKRAPDGVFVEDERRQMVARYEEAATTNEANAAQHEQRAEAAARPAVPETPDLTPEHRAMFVKAYESAAAGANVAAWEIMKPLVAAYPSSFAVQDLRCRIAMQALSFTARARSVIASCSCRSSQERRPRTAARPECDRIMQLSK